MSSQGMSLDQRIAGVGRAFGGAFLFSLPMLMTMELWWLGFTMDRLRIVLLLLVALPVLVGLAHRIGFEPTFDWREDLRDSFIALGVGLVASTIVLFSFGIVDFTMPLDEICGKVVLQTLSASIGALLGRSQFGANKNQEISEEQAALRGYPGELFMMSIGALFLGMNVAPTEEVILISYIMTPWHALGLLVLSILLMQAFVYALTFKKSSALASGHTRWRNILRYTLPGYVIALLISLYVLWSFGRTTDLSLIPILMSVIVLGFPAAIGAAAARLLL